MYETNTYATFRQLNAPEADDEGKLFVVNIQFNSQFQLLSVACLGVVGFPVLREKIYLSNKGLYGVDR